MKFKSTAAVFLVVFSIIFCSCTGTTIDGVPKDKINIVTDGSFIEPDFVSHRVARLLYEDLTQSEQLLYRHFYNSVFSHPEFIAVPDGLEDASVKRVFLALKYDNPHILCLKNSYKIMSFGKQVFLHPDYVCSVEKCAEASTVLTERALKLCAEAKTLDSDFEKELFLHDGLVSFCEYSAENTVSNAYDALVTGQSACTGYAMAMKLLLDCAGIKAAAVSGNAGTDGESMQTHMWLTVQLGGRWYHLDPTWDDPVGVVLPNPVHAWFNVTDEEISQTHHGYTLPKNVVCRSADEGFYHKKKLLCDGENNGEIIKNALLRAKTSGDNFIEIKFDSFDGMTSSSKELFEDGKIHQYMPEAGFSGETRISYTENPTMSVLYIYFEE